MESIYLFERSEGLVHIRLRADPARCVACVRLDAYEIVVAEVRREVLSQVQDLVQRKVVRGV